MSKINIFSIIRVTVFIIAVTLIPSVIAQNSKFTVVIDAGHGGHDPGAIGKISREKDINLAVSTHLGELIASNYNDVKVVFTRTTDKYLTLQERAHIVNNNHADLFISIHTNAAQSTSAYGTESFTLGLAKSKGNLDVAMRENAVMLLEDDYKSKYKGFDPTSVDSYIMFEFMQDKYIDRSISIASDIQNHFKNYAGRSDRGVRQAGFWVLYQSACPSVLIELGFISNSAEEKYLASNAGQKQLAESIYKAFVGFKYEHDKKSGKSTKKSFNETESIKIDDVGRYDKRADGAAAPLKSVVANTKEAVVPVSEIAKPPLEKEIAQTKADKKNNEKQVKDLSVDNQQANNAKSDKKTDTSSKKDKKSTDKKSSNKNEIIAEKLANDTDVIADTFSKGKQKSVNETTTKINEIAESDVDELKETKAETKTPAKINEEENGEIQQVKSSQTIAKPKPISAEKKQYVDMRAYEAATEKPVYKLQLFSRSKKLNTNAAEFRGIRNADFYVENGMYKYTIGSDSKYEMITKLRKEMLPLFPDAFVIAFLGKTKIPINDAIKLTNKNK
jgi:N-acetylmuramoyl-L-alanine amidase